MEYIRREEDDFVYKVVSYEQAKAIFEQDLFPLFIVYIDCDYEALIEDVDTIEAYRNSGVVVYGIEVGFIK